MKPLSDCRLYGFIDTAYLRGRPATDIARQLCDGGADLIQLRAKNCSADAITRMAEAIVPITRACGVGLVINDHIAIAEHVGAELCHWGQEDFEQARNESGSGGSGTCLGDWRIAIGLSTHAPEQAQAAIKAGAAYIAIGPVFPTATKPGVQAVTLAYVKWAASNVRIPWFAIGGINLENLDSVIEAGARRICVVSAILTSDDVARACQMFRKRLNA